MLTLRLVGGGIWDRQAVMGSRNGGYKELLTRFRADNPTAPTIESTDPVVVAEFIVKHARDDTARAWLAELISLSKGGGLSPGTIALLFGGLLAGAGVMYGIFIKPGFLPALATVDQARGLVTFLFAFATIAVVLITVIAVFWVPAGEVGSRGAAAKDLLTILIGIMGTILGFYFGSADNAPATVPAEANEAATE